MSDQPVVTPPGQAETDDLIDIGALISALWRGKYFIGLCMGAALFIGIYLAYVRAVPMFEASATVLLEDQQDNIIDLQSVTAGFGGGRPETASEVEVIRARSLMERVVDRLDLMNDPEFNEQVAPPEEVGPIGGAIDLAVSQTKLAIKRLFGIAPEPVDPDAPPKVPDPQEVRDQVVTNLLDAVTVTNQPTDSYVFVIRAVSIDRRKAVLLADTIVYEYILNQIDVKYAATEQATVWLSNRVGELQQDLEEAEAKVTDFTTGTDLVSPETQAALERQLKDMRDRQAESQAAATAAQARLQALEAATTPAEKAAAAADPQLSAMLPRAAAGDSLATESFATRFEQVLARAGLEVQRAESQITTLTAAEADLEDRYTRQSQDLITLQQLTREAEASRALYEYFLSRLKETSAQQGIQQADSRVLSRAVIPQEPYSPKKKLILAAALLLGAMLGAALVLLREMRATTFRNATDLEGFTGRTVLGQVPLVPVRGRAGILKYIHNRPNSAVAEAVRNLRTSIMFSNIDNPPQIIMSTSALPGEGKTTTSITLAQNLAAMGKKVLLIEGDIRRRTFGQYFNSDTELGLVSVITGAATLEEAVFRSDYLAADILKGEHSATNAADIFSSERFKAFTDDLRSRYDFVVIDTPPVLIVPDARIIARNADAVIFAVRWDRTQQKQVADGLRMFDSVGQNVTGLVLTQVNPKGMRRYGYGASYGAYASYGSKYYHN